VSAHNQTTSRSCPILGGVRRVFLKSYNARLDRIDAIAHLDVARLDRARRCFDLRDEVGGTGIIAHSLKLQIGRVARGDDLLSLTS
jgi:hypothetical protein